MSDFRRLYNTNFTYYRAVPDDESVGITTHILLNLINDGSSLFFNEEISYYSLLSNLLILDIKQKTNRFSFNKPVSHLVSKKNVSSTAASIMDSGCSDERINA